MAQGGNYMQLQRQDGEPLIDFIVDQEQNLNVLKQIKTNLNFPNTVLTFISRVGMQDYLDKRAEYVSRVPNPRYRLIQVLITDQKSKLLPTFTVHEVLDRDPKINRFVKYSLKKK